MTLLIGNKRTENGFTFIEVMLAIVILATGIVAIYKTYLLFFDQQSYLVHRIYASNLIDKKIFEIESDFKTQGPEAIKAETSENMTIDHKQLVFEVRVFPQQLLDLEDVLQADIGIFWSERGRPVRLTRSVYISR